MNVKEAAERMRRYIAGDSGILRMPYPGGLGQCDRHLIVSAYLAEHPADDDEPITDEWLTESFKEWSAPYGAKGWELLANCIIRNTDHGYFPVLSYTGQGPTGAKLSTRGDVRRLCAALGITLTSGEAAKG